MEGINQLKASKTSGKTAVFVSLLLAAILIILIILIVILVKFQPKPETSKAQVITVSTLEKIIKVSELSTFTAVYNGIAEVKNSNNPEKTDYFVSYEARVKAGIDFDKIAIKVDDEDRVIRVDIPDAYITDINVDISSLDFIFYNKKINQSTITQEAYKACEEDVQEESKKQDAILKLAQQNAENIVKALVNPIIEQLDTEYALVVE